MIQEIQDNNKIAHEVGEEIAKLLHCMVISDKYQTAWGGKTAMGLARSIVEVINGKKV